MSQQQKQKDRSEQPQRTGGYLVGEHDEVERLKQLYTDGEIDEEELAERLTDDRLREHDHYKRRQRKAKRFWRRVTVGGLIFMIVAFVWAQNTGVQI